MTVWKGIRYEWKKVFNVRKVIFLSLLFLMGCVILFMYSFYTSDLYVGEKDFQVILERIQSKKASQSNEEMITDEKLQNAVRGFQEIMANRENFDSSGNLKLDSKEEIQKFNANADLVNLAIRAYSPLFSFDPQILQTLNLKEMHARDIMDNRNIQLQQLLPSYQKKATDSFQIGYSFGWQSLLLDLSNIQLLIMIVCGVITPLFYFIEKRNQMRSILNTCFFGGESLDRIKLCTAFLTSSLIYISIIFIYSFVKLEIYGWEGGNLLIQSSYLFWLSPFLITYKQAFWMVAILGYLAVLFMVIFSLWLSKVIENPYMSWFWTLLFIFLPLAFNNEPWLCLFPSNMIGLSGNLLSLTWVLGINFMVWRVALLTIICGGILFKLISPLKKR